MRTRILIMLTFYFCSNAFGQGVGLVLSGGGASGFAHIGVLKALEENGIPINYISGTSAGALVGSMYACGYSPNEIEEYVSSEKFQLMTSGDLERKQEFLLREDDDNANIISFSFSSDSLFQKALPTNFIRPELLDYEMVRLFGTVSAARSNNFDSLFVPFRCVASDIVAKKGTVFSHGHLNQAVRASMTFPFYVNPIRINGVLYFDGGLYNNFPADVMYNDFAPDFIIGSNVSNNAAPPNEDDLISQVTNMLVTFTNFEIPCEDGIIIQPQTRVETFQFQNVQSAIKEGYDATIKMIDSLKLQITERVSADELALRRMVFRSKIPSLRISETRTMNSKGEDESYVRKSILKNAKGQVVSEYKFERRYFRTYATPQIQYLFPTLSLKADSSYILDVEVKSAKDFRVDVGGIISSRAINTGFVQLNYLHLGRTASSIQLNSYFGKFYGSGKIAFDVHLPSYFPISFNGYLVLNRWDYFRNFATFFEDVKPSFLVQYETFAGAQIKLPIFNNSKAVADYRHFEVEDSYYQTENFTNKDTTDITRFYGDSYSFSIEQNSLNRKQFATAGTYFIIKPRYIVGKEHSVSGSTSQEEYDYRKFHQWINVFSEFKTFPVSMKRLAIGLHGITSITSQSLFKNYTATILNMTTFQPLPDMPTFFLPEYRSPQFIGGGLNIIFSPRKNFDLRFDGYIYQPFKQLVVNDDGTFGYAKKFKGETPTAAASAIYHSPLGPLRFTVNYFPKQEMRPFIFQFSYGYILFNDRAIR